MRRQARNIELAKHHSMTVLRRRTSFLVNVQRVPSFHPTDHPPARHMNGNGATNSINSRVKRSMKETSNGSVKQVGLNSASVDRKSHFDSRYVSKEEILYGGNFSLRSPDVTPVQFTAISPAIWQESDKVYLVERLHWPQPTEYIVYSVVVVSMPWRRNKT